GNTRTSVWYTPNLARVPGNTYTAPNGVMAGMACLVIEVSGLGPWDVVTGISTAYAARSASLTLALPAPAASAFTIAAVCGDNTAASQSLAPAGIFAVPKCAHKAADQRPLLVPSTKIRYRKRTLKSPSHHPERHKTHRIGWLRAAVLGANDGVLSTSSLVIGIAASNMTHGAILVSGVAGLVAGSMSMAAGEYVSVSSQSDTEKADTDVERRELAEDEVRRRRSRPASST